MFNRASLTDIVERTSNDVLSRLKEDELLRRSDAVVYSRVLAGLSHEMMGYLDYVAKQVLYDTSEDETLVRQASIWKVPEKPAEFAIGPVLAQGIAGRSVPLGTLIKRSDGVEYLTTADVALGAGSTQLQVKAIVAGAAGNAIAGVTLNIVQPIDGVQSQLIVDADGLVNGSDQESVPVFRSRFLRRLQQPPSGGTLIDYETWALEVPGVTRAWATSSEMGAGTITVRFVRDGDVSIIPDAAEILAVKNYIDARRPATSILYVVAPIAMPQVFGIQLTPGSAVVKAAVEAELRDLLGREARPAGTIVLSHIDESISVAAGEEDHVLVSPVANLVFTTGQMATFGSITWL